jgi:hypothetical protein
MTKVTQLPLATNISDNGVFVVVEGGQAKQLTWQTLKSGGIQGYTGSVGLGYAGSNGYTGSAGTHGNTGYTGSSGIQGSTGYVGSNGYTGSAGTQGNTGYTGSSGIQGSTGYVGSNGYTGSAGTQGNTGYTGSSGIQGSTGYVGSNGYTGSKGDQGYSGSTGYQGSAGNIGYQGSAGVGYQGSAGVGYQGSVGSTGYQGSAGNIGYQGSVGNKGDKGDTGYQGSAGVGYQGSVGNKGDKGDTGYQGSAGVGYQGSAGVGYQGSVGNKGDKGDTGYQGSAGVGYQGSVGNKGDKGDTGYQGSAGVGYQGSAGVGYQGSVGNKGDKGDTGYQGSAGNAGPSYSNTVNIVSFGADPTGSTDSSSAIQTAINSLSSGVVSFPPGTYLINTGLTMKPGVELKGVGTNSVTLTAGNNSMTLISYLNNSAAYASNFVIENLTLSSNNKTGCTGIALQGSDTSHRLNSVKISNATITATTSTPFSQAIYLAYSANNSLDKNYILCATNGITINVCSDTNIIDCNVQLGTGKGFYLKGNATDNAGAFDEGTRLISCTTNGQTYGLYLETINWGIVSGCSFTTDPSSGNSLYATGACQHWKFVGCEFASGTGGGYGINIVSSTAQGFVFNGCEIAVSTFGMVSAGTDIVINGCNFNNNSNVDIDIQSPGSKHLIVGNILQSSGSAFSIVESSGANYTLVANNMVKGAISLTGAQSNQNNNMAIS